MEMMERRGGGFAMEKWERRDSGFGMEMMERTGFAISSSIYSVTGVGAGMYTSLRGSVETSLTPAASNSAIVLGDQAVNATGWGLAGLEALVAGDMTVGASGLRREQQGEGREGLCWTAAGGGLSGVGKAAALAWRAEAEEPREGKVEAGVDLNDSGAWWSSAAWFHGRGQGRRREET
ncbi:hypothetical protein TRIUR3_29412 [Triticum urartu]|uniref:Uncharacterized protein n=1 Tax=Triticum urartu TaxID=4572 RepID=M7ZAS1_TRIUA|nr:hypothetical protein TRIUR3_29412 [Triticum urartu]